MNPWKLPLTFASAGF